MSGPAVYSYLDFVQPRKSGEIIGRGGSESRQRLRAVAGVGLGSGRTRTKGATEAVRARQGASRRPGHTMPLVVPLRETRLGTKDPYGRDRGDRSRSYDRLLTPWHESLHGSFLHMSNMCHANDSESRLSGSKDTTTMMTTLRK